MRWGLAFFYAALVLQVLVSLAIFSAFPPSGRGGEVAIAPRVPALTPAAASESRWPSLAKARAGAASGDGRPGSVSRASSGAAHDDDDDGGGDGDEGGGGEPGSANAGPGGASRGSTSPLGTRSQLSPLPSPSPSPKARRAPSPRSVQAASPPPLASAAEGYAHHASSRGDCAESHRVAVGLSGHVRHGVDAMLGISAALCTASPYCTLFTIDFTAATLFMCTGWQATEGAEAGAAPGLVPQRGWLAALKRGCEGYTTADAAKDEAELRHPGCASESASGPGLAPAPGGAASRSPRDFRISPKRGNCGDLRLRSVRIPSWPPRGGGLAAVSHGLEDHLAFHGARECFREPSCTFFSASAEDGFAASLCRGSYKPGQAERGGEDPGWVSGERPGCEAYARTDSNIDGILGNFPSCYAPAWPGARAAAAEGFTLRRGIATNCALLARPPMLAEGGLVEAMALCRSEPFCTSFAFHQGEKRVHLCNGRHMAFTAAEQWVTADRVGCEEYFAWKAMHQLWRHERPTCYDFPGEAGGEGGLERMSVGSPLFFSPPHRPSSRSPFRPSDCSPCDEGSFLVRACRRGYLMTASRQCADCPAAYCPVPAHMTEVTAFSKAMMGYQGREGSKFKAFNPCVSFAFACNGTTDQGWEGNRAKAW